MNLNDKKTRITLRVNEKQFSYIQEKAKMLGVSPSEFLRMCVNSLMYAENSVSNKVMEVSRRENEQTCINDNI